MNIYFGSVTNNNYYGSNKPDLGKKGFKELFKSFYEKLKKLKETAELYLWIKPVIAFSVTIIAAYFSKS